MKNILLLGAGKSASVLMDYLNTTAVSKNWKVMVADANLDILKSKTKHLKAIEPIQLQIENESERQTLISKADIVISLMPPHLHFLVAKDCLQFKRNLLTASYIDETTKVLADEAKNQGVLFLYEMGLDPGIDHMSAMQIIDEIKSNGGTITSFISHCGGLVAPESDDNPWHYKISWNPRNVVMAGKAGATFLKNNNVVNIEYKELFTSDNLVEISEENYLAFYPNRDSLSYIKTYELDGVETFIRTTLRDSEFCLGWKNVIDLKLTNEDKIYDTNGMTLNEFFKLHFNNNGFSKWFDEIMLNRMNKAKETLDKLMDLLEAEEEAIARGETPEQNVMMVDAKGNINSVDVEDLKMDTAELIATKINEANISMKQLLFLGLDDKATQINLGLASAADVLQFSLERKLALKTTDKDMIVMLHEIEYLHNNSKKKIKSLLKVIGNNSVETAMAKTVGLPLGIAAKLILEGSIKETGLHIPISKNIYEPVLLELKQQGILFEENEFDL